MDDFDRALQEIIEERISVLFEIERAIFTRRYSLSSKHQDIFSTQSISMIYSLWESFIQKSFNLYIDELNKVGRDLHPTFRTLKCHIENFIQIVKTIAGDR